MRRPLAPMVLIPLALAVTGCVSLDTDETQPPPTATVPVEQSIIPSDSGLYSENEEKSKRMALSDAAFWGAKFELDPTNADAALRFADALFRARSSEEAVNVLSRTANLLPNRADVLSAYGKALTKTGKPAQSLSYLALAHTLKPSDWTILSAQGVAYDLMGEFNQARLKYEAALERSPKNPHVLNNLALSQVQRQDLNGAEQYLRLAVAQPNATPQMRQNLAMVLAMKGELTEAREWAAQDLPAEMVDANLGYYASLNGKQATEGGAQPPVAPVPDPSEGAMRDLEPDDSPRPIESHGARIEVPGSEFAQSSGQDQTGPAAPTAQVSGPDESRLAPLSMATPPMSPASDIVPRQTDPAILAPQPKPIVPETFAHAAGKASKPAPTATNEHATSDLSRERLTSDVVKAAMAQVNTTSVTGASGTPAPAVSAGKASAAPATAGDRGGQQEQQEGAWSSRLTIRATESPLPPPK